MAIKYIKAYHPDFMGEKNLRRFHLQQECYAIEVKGLLRVEDKAKLNLVREQYPFLKIVLVFQDINGTVMGAKLKNHEWCAKHGFECFDIRDTDKIPRSYFE